VVRNKRGPLCGPLLFVYDVRLRLDLLELLEGLAAVAAVVDSAAEGGSEGVFHCGIAGVAVGAFDYRQQLDKVGACGHHFQGHGRGEAGGFQDLAAFFGYAVRCPGLVHCDCDAYIMVGGEGFEALTHAVFDYFECGATYKGGEDLDGECAVIEGDFVKYTQVYYGEMRDFGVHDFHECVADVLFGYLLSCFHIIAFPSSRPAHTVKSASTQ
jgi:hypothetical protein